MSSQPVSAVISEPHVVAALTTKVKVHTLSFWGKVACITFCWLAFIPLIYWAYQNSEKSKALQELKAIKASSEQRDSNDPTEQKVNFAAQSVRNSNNQPPEVHISESGQEPEQKKEICERVSSIFSSQMNVSEFKTKILPLYLALAELEPDIIAKCEENDLFEFMPQDHLPPEWFKTKVDWSKVKALQGAIPELLQNLENWTTAGSQICCIGTTKKPAKSALRELIISANRCEEGIVALAGASMQTLWNIAEFWDGVKIDGIELKREVFGAAMLIRENFEPESFKETVRFAEIELTKGLERFRKTLSAWKETRSEFRIPIQPKEFRENYFRFNDALMAYHNFTKNKALKKPQREILASFLKKIQPIADRLSDAEVQLILGYGSRAASPCKQAFEVKKQQCEEKAALFDSNLFKAQLGPVDSVTAKTAIQRIVNIDDAPIFSKALELFRLENDLRLVFIRSSARQEFIKNNYPLLVNAFNLSIDDVFNAIIKRGQTDLSCCMKDCIEVKGIIKGALLIRAVYATAGTSLEQVLHNIKQVSKNWDAVQSIFSRVTQEEAETVLRDLTGSPSNDMALVRPLVLLGFGLGPVGSTVNLDAYNRALLTPLQLQVWDNRQAIIDKGMGALQAYVDRMVQQECDLYPIQEELQPYIDGRNEDNVTQQFEKDGHRYEKLVLTRSDGSSVLFPGENTRNASKSVLLNRLREFATEVASLDPVLFAILQESVCQNIEKSVTEEQIRLELKKVFGDERLVGFIPITWNKECIGLKKVDDTHFKVTHDYNLVTVHPGTEVKMSRKIRLEFSIQPGEAAGSWTIGTPHRSCLPNDAQGLAATKHAIALAKLAARPEEPAAVDNSVAVDDEKEPD